MEAAKRSWVTKAAVQKAVSVLPGATGLNDWFRLHVTGRAVVTEGLMNVKLRAVSGHLAVARSRGIVSDGFSAIDLGGGWHPIVPLCLHLAGADRVYMIDIEDRLRLDAVTATLRAVAEWAEAGRLDECLGGPSSSDRIAAIARAAEVVPALGVVAGLAQLGIIPVIGDARRLPLEPVDLVVSSTTLEHIPYDVMVGILAELARVTRHRGLMTHHVDLCDHHIYGDPSITVYNFLRFSERTWKLIDNTLQPMNRLRIDGYRAAYREAGVEITEEWFDPGDLDELAMVQLAEPFSQMDPEDVAVKTARFTTLVDHSR